MDTETKQDLGWIGIAAVMTALTIIITLSFELNACDLLFWMDEYKEACS